MIAGAGKGKGKGKRERTKVQAIIFLNRQGKNEKITVHMYMEEARIICS